MSVSLMLSLEQFIEDLGKPLASVGFPRATIFQPDAAYPKSMVCASEKPATSFAQEPLALEAGRGA